MDRFYFSSIERITEGLIMSENIFTKENYDQWKKELSEELAKYISDARKIERLKRLIKIYES